MWDALQSKDRALAMRYPSRPSVCTKEAVLHNSKVTNVYADRTKGTHPYALEVARYTFSDGAVSRDNNVYGKGGPGYNFITTRNEETPRAVPSPYRRVSSNNTASSPKGLRPETPPKGSVRTASDIAQLPKPLVLTRSPLHGGDGQSRRVSTDQFYQEQPSVDCKCPEINYARARGGQQLSKNQSPIKAKKKYVFSPRDSCDNDLRDSNASSLTSGHRSFPLQNARHTSHNSSSQSSATNHRTTPLKYEKDGTFTESKVVAYRTTPNERTNIGGGRNSNVAAVPNVASQTGSMPKRLSNDNTQTRRASNPTTSHNITDSTPSTISSSISEHVDQNTSSSAGEFSRTQQVWTPKVVGVADSTITVSSSKVQDVPVTVITKKLPVRSFTSENNHEHIADPNERKPVRHQSHSPLRVLESSISSFTDSELDTTRAKSVSAVPRYNFVSSRILLATFMQRWKSKYEENKNAYFDGGYLKVKKGILIENRYVVIQKLGWGEFSTVWLAYDTKYYAFKRTARESFVALKIAKCKRFVAENTTYEINLLRYLCTRLTRCPMTKLLDSFSIAGEYGNHLCMVMPLHGANLLSIIDQMKAAKRQRKPEEIRMIKEVIASTLVGLHELSTINVIHTDIKPENVIATAPDPKIVDLMISFCRHNSKSPKRRVVSEDDIAACMTEGDPNHLVCLADFGLSASLDSIQSVEKCSDRAIKSLMAKVVGCKKQFPVTTPGTMNNRGTLIQTREYRAPEVILGLNFNCQTDVWSVGCTAFELITGCFLMDPKKRSSNERHMDVEHLASMMQLIGPIPPEVTNLRTRYNSYFEARERGQNVALPDGVPVYIDRFIDARGKFIYADRYRHYERRRLDVELETFLPPSEAKMAASFILTCLYCYDPQNRPTAKEMLDHPWLKELHQHTSPKTSN